MGVRGGAAENASAVPAAQVALPGEEAAAELARALAQIAQEDPDGAASLGASLGLRSAVQAPAATQSGPVRPVERFMGSLVQDPSEDFDVDVTLTAAVLGSRMVGKSALIRHVVRGTFSEDYHRSITAEFVEKRMSFPAEEEVTFHIWVFPGGEDPASYVQSCCRKAQAYLIAFSTDDRASFEMVEDWVVAIRKVHGPEALLILAQTKCDLVGTCDAGASKEEVEALARRLDLRLCLSSAQNGVGTTETFECIGTELLARARRAEEEFRAGKAFGGLQWESAPTRGSAPVWTEALPEAAAAAAAASASGLADKGEGAFHQEAAPGNCSESVWTEDPRAVAAASSPGIADNGKAVTAGKADANDSDEDVGLPLPGL